MQPPPLPDHLIRTQQSQPPMTPQRRSGLGWGCGLLLAGALLVVVLAIAGVAWLIHLGWGMFAGQAQAALQEDPVVREHIGQIQDMDLDMIGTGDARGGNEFVFRLKGDRGKGTVRAEFISTADSEELGQGELKMADGTRYTLPGDAESDTDDGEIQ